MYEHEAGVKYNIAETCCASISLDDLQQLSDNKTKSPLSTSTKMTYGAIRGSEALRTNLARLYSSKVSTPLSPDNIIITPGAIQANFEVLYTLTGPGDHVICVHPTYQQLYSVPESLGAEVSLWMLKEEESFVPNVEALQSLVKSNTKLIILKYVHSVTVS
jgi:aspartate/methionine/tyrosine aminotransferase